VVVSMSHPPPSNRRHATSTDVNREQPIHVGLSCGLLLPET
jgi:hypothetical protein